MNVIELTDTTETALTKMAEGNPGALRVLCELLTNFEDGVIAIMKLDDMQIRSWKIWVGFKDYCKEDLNKFYNLIMDKDKEMMSFIHAYPS